MRHLFLFLLTITAYLGYSHGMTRAQLKKTMTVVKKQCVPKIGVTEDKISKIEDGVFLEDRKVMCYITCVYKSLQVIRNERLDRELISKQVDVLYPNDMKDAVKKAVDKCFHVQDNYNELCEAVFHAVKCLYEADPPNFVFP